MRLAGGMADGTMPAGTGQGLLATARTLLREGRLLEAAAVLDRVGDTDLAAPADRATLPALRVELLLARGDLRGAMAAADALSPLLDHPSYAGAVARHAHGELAAALGELDTALEHHLATGRLLGPGTVGSPPLPWRCGAAVVLLHLGRQREAGRLAREQLEQPEVRDSAYLRALALRTLATADLGADRVATLRAARAALTGVRAARLAAQIDTDLAGLLLLWPGSGPAQAEEALALLRAAEDYAGRQELRPLQGRVHRLLDRLGEAPRPVRSEALAALTAGEQRVARLAADGLTNRQIAERLVITVKAVEWHLSHVYRKLGIPSRHRLPAALGVPA